jgi:putative hemolysin
MPVKGGFLTVRPMRVSFAALFAAALSVSACQTSDNSNQTPLQPTVVQPTLSTKTFTGTVNVASQTNTNFTTTDAGTLAVTLTAAGPPATITMGMFLGQPLTSDATQCVNAFGLSGTTQASSTPQISVTAPAGNYCVAIGDVGQATGPISYTFTVTGAFGS